MRNHIPILQMFQHTACLLSDSPLISHLSSRHSQLLSSHSIRNSTKSMVLIAFPALFPSTPAARSPSHLSYYFLYVFMTFALSQGSVSIYISKSRCQSDFAGTVCNLYRNPSTLLVFLCSVLRSYRGFQAFCGLSVSSTSFLNCICCKDEQTMCSSEIFII